MWIIEVNPQKNFGHMEVQSEVRFLQVLGSIKSLAK